MKATIGTGLRASVAVAVLFFLGTARAELLLSVTLDTQTPAPGQPVSLGIRVENTGAFDSGNLVIENRFDDVLVIPAGQAAWVSTGEYDDENGEWRLGLLAAGESAAAEIPLVVSAPSPPPCAPIVVTLNRSESLLDSLSVVRTALRTAQGIRCVELGVESSIKVGGPFPSCDSRERYTGEIVIRNSGPDPATQVRLDFEQFGNVGPNIELRSFSCSNGQCNLGTVLADQSVVLTVTSDDFQDYDGFMRSVSSYVSTVDIDYFDENDAFVEDVNSFAFSRCIFDFGDLDLEIGAIGGPACFIATAAYGSGFDKRVDTHRRFRDRYLLPTTWGRAFVRFYYRHSPPIAAYIEDKPALRALVRGLLTPLVLLIQYPLPLLIGALLLRLLASLAPGHLLRW